MQEKIKSLYILASVSVIAFILVLACLIFGLTGTIDFWQGWIFLTAFCIPTCIITIYLMINDPVLLERRIKSKETRPQQILGQSIAGFLFLFGLLGVPALDNRFAWSSIPIILTIISDVLILIGFIIVFFVFRYNSFTSKVIVVMSNQKVITDGPYSVVRHPMYLGAILIILFTPLALNSWWGMIAVIPLCIIVVFRILDEEKLLSAELDGYKEYCQKTKYRIIPYIW
ncbi:MULTISPECIES: methyltransferase family protein [unclassified Clostridioides]|uniref:methyltransferase family protein n=2 Tax=unclassified Clostridioides TaxID=2635829 RepID=UPI001D0C5881|nr:isoprenylcysteine carboxylmethyltransferase family protein [Clostridioides sp. ES-S-0001-02]MCC0639817.1 isoprenylcysteine carboxylmethyltransferase family protein [Clostridioides sp. ES-S-0049-03]MCC0653562.1 isoprenylcysteine carboxylmethyltransferase family protein [Clostridioides sp. ES-S-0001-03]MCC0671284.1 isoprenylcysteine carboxylmethyltransferase family protein [Clostridioides sp. ES-S-0145-01]MCC0679438.1 isoprenylcysteine carboxylmethyltransferase family protein [Clostridioides s